MRGCIIRRGKHSWRLKFDAGRDPVTGRRLTRLITVRGRRQDAERALTKLLDAADCGTLAEPSKLTVKDYVGAWLDNPQGLSAKTAERYRQLAEGQICPHLGALPLQKLRPAHIQDWHATLLKSGGKGGRPLGARTVGHAHRVLHRALARAAQAELIARNVASIVKPPAVEHEEITALAAGQISDVLDRIKDHALFPIIALALGTGMRRGELLALRWSCVDLDGAALRVEQSLEETRDGLRFKSPKTKHGRRTISLPASAVTALRTHRVQQLEQRLVLGLGRPDGDALVFSKLDGSPMSPDNLSRDWRRLTKAHKLPRVMFHALRHSHASALIAAGLDVLAVARRLGHGSPVITLTTYAHLFQKSDTAAASAIEAAMRTSKER